MSDHDIELTRLGAIIEHADRTRNGAVADAKAAASVAAADGVPVAAIARALGVTRVTAYAWIGDDN